MTITDLLAEYIDRPALAKALKCSERTIARYEKQGLPSLMIAGRKHHPLNGVAKWFKAREEA